MKTWAYDGRQADTEKEEVAMPDAFNRIAIGTTSGIGEATMRKFVQAGFGVVGNGSDE